MERICAEPLRLEVTPLLSGCITCRSLALKKNLRGFQANYRPYVNDDVYDYMYDYVYDDDYVYGYVYDYVYDNVYDYVYRYVYDYVYNYMYDYDNVYDYVYVGTVNSRNNLFNHVPKKSDYRKKAK